MGRVRARMGGFTLPELMVVVGILGLLAAIAAPNMAAMIRTQRIKTAAFDVFAGLSFARSEAIKRNATVTVTPTTSGNWATGWSITDSNGAVLRTQSGWDNLTASGPATVSFGGSGRANATTSIALTATGVNTTAYRCVKLDLSGRAATVEGAC